MCSWVMPGKNERFFRRDKQRREVMSWRLLATGLKKKPRDHNWPSASCMEEREKKSAFLIFSADESSREIAAAPPKRESEGGGRVVKASLTSPFLPSKTIKPKIKVPRVSLYFFLLPSGNDNILPSLTSCHASPKKWRFPCPLVTPPRTEANRLFSFPNFQKMRRQLNWPFFLFIRNFAVSNEQKSIISHQIFFYLLPREELFGRIVMMSTRNGPGRIAVMLVVMPHLFSMVASLLAR